MISFLLLVLFILYNNNNVNGELKGHMKPLGSHCKPKQVDVIDGVPSAEVFLNEYVNKCKALVMRNSHQSLGIKKWDEKYLIDNYGKEYIRLEPKREKEADNIEVIDKYAIPLQEYMTQHINDVYVVSQIPQAMSHEFELPKVFNCAPFKDSLLETNLWISTGETSSSLHKDAFNTVNCQIRGTKEWILIDHRHVRNVPIAKEGDTDPNTETAGFSLLNPDKVDMKKYPKMQKVPWMNVTMNPGDCLYLPGSMLHQVKSSPGYNIACTLMFGGPTSANRGTRAVRLFGKLNETECEKAKAIPSNEADIAWTYDGKGKASMTMGFEDPDNVRRRWLESAQQYKKIDLKIFRRIMKNMIKERIEEGLDDRHKSSSFDVKKETKKAVEQAVNIIFNNLAGDKGYITSKQIQNSKRQLWKEGLDAFIRIDYMHSLYDGSANQEYSKENNGDEDSFLDRRRDEDNRDRWDDDNDDWGKNDDDDDWGKNDDDDDWNDENDENEDWDDENVNNRKRRKNNNQDEDWDDIGSSTSSSNKRANNNIDDEDWGEDVPITRSSSYDNMNDRENNNNNNNEDEEDDEDVWSSDAPDYFQHQDL